MANNLVPPNYNDYLYRLTYFLMKPLAPYVPRSISPNQITVVSFLSAMIGTAILFFMKSPAAYLYWVFFNFIWFLLDALDGIHARYSNQTSEYGAFLDHALDNIYFLFMFTVFVQKFHLLNIVYVYAIILRTTASLMVFLSQCHTKQVYLGRFTGGLEFILLSTVMILSYCYPDFNPAQHTSNATLLHAIQLLDLQQGMFMKLVLLFYSVGIPFNMIFQFRFVMRMTSQEK